MEENNTARLSGKIVSEYDFYHETLGEKFYKVNIAVKRMSGEEDILPVIVSEKLLTEENMSATNVLFTGQIRTFNTENSNVEMYLFAKNLELVDENTFINEVKLNGFLCKKNQIKTTHSKRMILTFILAINTRFKKSYYINVLAWGLNSIYIHNQKISTNLEVEGRFQSRKFYKKDENGKRVQHTTYEISSSMINVIK